MSTLILELNNEDYATFYGVDDWEEGLNMFDYPIPENNGFHLVADIRNAEGETVYFSYNSKEPKVDVLWTSSNVEEGPYLKANMAFIDLLNLIYKDQYSSLLPDQTI